MSKTKLTVAAYRKAAKQLFHVSDVEVETYIKDPAEDRGQWAPDALAIIYLEPDCRQAEDLGILPEVLGYYSENGMEECARLDAETELDTFIEYINAAVAAVWPA